MEEFGLQFDDDLFSETKAKPEVAPKSYNARIEHRLWFSEGEDATETPGERAYKRYKCQADWAFYRKDYRAAIPSLEQCIEHIEDNQGTVRRDCWEALARCHVHLGHPGLALPLALKLLEGPKTPEQKAPGFVLLADVYAAAGNVIGELVFVEKAVACHPFLPDLWNRLGRLFLRAANVSENPTVLKGSTKSCTFCCLADDDETFAGQFAATLIIGGDSFQKRGEENCQCEPAQRKDDGCSKTDDIVGDVCRVCEGRGVGALVRARVLYEVLDHGNKSYVKTVCNPTRKQIENTLEGLLLRSDTKYDLKQIREVICQDLRKDYKKEEAEEDQSSLLQLYLDCEAGELHRVFCQHWFDGLPS